MLCSVFVVKIRSVPLQTRSCVLTCEPSSIVCKEKSISGTGFLSWRARTMSMFSAMLIWILECEKRRREAKKKEEYQYGR